jgi:RNA polymerase sigma factor (sigma-70 family)
MATAVGMTFAAAASTDEELVAATRSGDDRAFEELYSRYRSRISAFAHGMTHDYGRAEDIAQEVFISALRRLRATDRPIAFKPWIFEIARNACIDEHRRTRRSREVPIERDGDGDSDLGELRLAHAATPAADVAAESKQALKDLRGAFAGLSERHHKIIVLRELEGLSYSEIGDKLGMSKMVVESTLFRARRRLTEEYDDLASGRRCEHVQKIIESGCERRRSSLGLRERRAISSHLQYCTPCRRHAVSAGVDESLLRGPRVVEKVAALLPIPWFALRRFGRVLGRGAHHVAAQPAALMAQIGPGSSDTLVSASRALAAAATVLVASVGGGLAVRAATSGSSGSAVKHARVHAALPAASIPAGHVAAARVSAGRIRSGGAKRASGRGAAHSVASASSATAPSWSAGADRGARAVAAKPTGDVPASSSAATKPASKSGGHATGLTAAPASSASSGVSHGLPAVAGGKATANVPVVNAGTQQLGATPTGALGKDGAALAGQLGQGAHAVSNTSALPAGS